MYLEVDQDLEVNLGAALHNHSLSEAIVNFQC